MKKEEVLIVIYRALRDSISKDILDVEFVKESNTIKLYLKGSEVSYPFDKSHSTNNNFQKSIWTLNENSIFSSTSKSVSEKKSILSWIKSKI